VPELWAREAAHEGAGELADSRIHAYNRDSHRVPLGARVVSATLVYREDAMLSISNS
jgi:hypothetical protein